MENLELRDEIEMRINPSDFSISSSELIEIMNMFNVNEEEVVTIYSEIFEEKNKELREIIEEVINEFRDKGNYYPSYKEFRELFDKYEDGIFINDEILRNMYKKEITDENQLSIFEMIKNTSNKAISESDSDEDFDIAASKIMKNWGGEIKKDRSAKLNPEDIFDIVDAGAAARADIEAEFGEDDFMPMSDEEYSNIMGGIDEAIDEKSLFKIEDAEGNIINKHALVTPVNGINKKGRVIGFGDDGHGSMQVIVSWEWPIDMKFTNPEEMVKERIYPKDIIIADSKNIAENIDDSEFNNLNFDKKSLYKWILDALYQLDGSSKEDIAMSIEKAFERDYDYKLKMNEMDEDKINESDFLNELEDCTEEDEMTIEEMRSLGSGVKNSGDRNVKLNIKHNHAPLTNLDLNESVNLKIKKLFEGSVTKKQLSQFISEQAREVAGKLKK